jgi:hypothetical protein
MAEELKRHPYQPPQTSMERHLVDLVEHVRNGTDSRAGFAQKVEAAQDHAFWLEKTCRDQRAEIERLYKMVIPGLPSVTTHINRVDTRDPSGFLPGGCLSFLWEMEAIRWKGVWNGFDHKDAQVEKEVKTRTYRQLLRLVRKEFERTFKLNMSRLRAAS